MFYLLYKITNKLNGKFYIGIHKTDNIDDGYMGSGKYLRHAISKYGIHNFEKEILSIFDNPEDMYQAEANIVTVDFISENNTYNLKCGGHGGFDYINSTKKNLYGKNGENGKRHIRRANEIRKEKWRTDEDFRRSFKINMSRAKKACIQTHWIGKHHTEDTKRKIGEANSIKQSGERNSQFGTEWITNGVENKKIKKGTEYPAGFKKGRSPSPK